MFTKQNHIDMQIIFFNSRGFLIYREYIYVYRGRLGFQTLAILTQTIYTFNKNVKMLCQYCTNVTTCALCNH